MILTFHHTAFGGPDLNAETLLRAIRVAAPCEGFVGQLGDYGDAGAWTFADEDGDVLVPLVARVSAIANATVQLHSVRIEMDLTRGSVTWRFHPRSLAIRSPLPRSHWRSSEPIEERAHADGREDIDDQALEGTLMADQLIASVIGAGVVGADQPVVVPEGTPNAGALRLDRRLVALASRMSAARSVTWEPTSEGQLAVTVLSASGDRICSVISIDEAAALGASTAP